MSHDATIRLSLYDPAVHKAAKRKAKFFRRPDSSDYRAMAKWQASRVAPSVTPREIVTWLWEANEDERTCDLCGEPIDIAIRGLDHPQAAQADHITPRGWGGDDTWGNLRVTHGACNRFRSNGLEWSREQYQAAMARSLERHSVPAIARIYVDLMRHCERAVEDYATGIANYERLLANPEALSRSTMTRAEAEAWLQRNRDGLNIQAAGVMGYGGLIEEAKRNACSHDNLSRECTD